jgi:hypothetical protein
MDANDLEDAPGETIEEGQGHERRASPSALWPVKLGQGVSGPFRFTARSDQVKRSLDLASEKRELMPRNAALCVFREAVHPMVPEEFEAR